MPGGRPTKLNKILRYQPQRCPQCATTPGRTPDGNPCPTCHGTATIGNAQPITVADTIINAIRTGQYVETAAGLANISKDTIHTWLKEGTRLSSDIVAGRTTLSKLRADDRRLVQFSDAVATALAESEARIVGTIAAAGELPHQIRKETTVTKTVDGRAVTETTVTIETRPPDWRAEAWRAERRFSKKWGQRIFEEITGADGQPITVEVRAANLLDRARQVRAQAAGDGKIIDIGPRALTEPQPESESDDHDDE